LSPSLGGLTAALIQRSPHAQFVVSDDHVRAFVGDQNTSTPAPDSNFNPIRAGYLDLERLRIVDTFGQVAHIDDFSELKVASSLAGIEGRPVCFAPRLVQPSR